MCGRVYWIDIKWYLKLYLIGSQRANVCLLIVIYEIFLIHFLAF